MGVYQCYWFGFVVVVFEVYCFVFQVVQLVGFQFLYGVVKVQVFEVQVVLNYVVLGFLWQCDGQCVVVVVYVFVYFGKVRVDVDIGGCCVGQQSVV